MGPSAVRITAETFVTPPEFDGLKLGAAFGRPDRRRPARAVAAVRQRPSERAPGALLPAGSPPRAAAVSSRRMSRPASFICSIPRRA